MINHKTVFIIGCWVLASGIILAAVGAHKLSSDVWRSANFMQMVHGIGLLFLSLFPKQFSRVGLLWCWRLSVALMLTGLIGFCLHLYLKVAGNFLSVPGWFAPLGGMSFFAAWILMSVASLGVNDPQGRKSDG